MNTERPGNAALEVGDSTRLFWSFVPRKVKEVLYLRHRVVFNLYPSFPGVC